MPIMYSCRQSAKFAPLNQPTSFIVAKFISLKCKKVMKKWLLVVLAVVSLQASKAQTTEWKDVAHIFYDNCTTCHRPGEIGIDYVNATGYTALVNSPWFYSI